MYSRQIAAILDQVAVATTALQFVVSERRRFDKPYEELQEAELLLLQACQKINEVQESEEFFNRQRRGDVRHGPLHPLGKYGDDDPQST